MASLAFAGGNVHVATLAVWAVLLLADILFVRLVAVRPLHPMTATGGPS